MSFRGFLFCLLFQVCWLINVSASEAVSYRVAESPWAEANGNHRAVIDVSTAVDAVAVRLPWRRRDNPATKRIMVVSATGATVPQVLRAKVTPESADLVFGPVAEPGLYYVYYLPFHVQPGWGYYRGGYLAPEAAPEQAWLDRNNLTVDMNIDVNEALVRAKLIAFEARTAFDSFFPMEVPLTAMEMEKFMADHEDTWMVFTEDRRFPIRMKDRLPLRWRGGPSAGFSGEALRNEYYVFQLGVFAARQSLGDLKVAFSPLVSGSSEIPPAALTCFNTGGVNAYGEDFIKRVDVAKGQIQPLWIGVDLAEDVVPGIYQGTVTLETSDGGTRRISVALTVEDKLLADRGDSELWRHARLRWLNSRMGIADTLVPPYTPLKRDANRVKCLGREVTLGDGGIPEQVTSGETAVLAKPACFVVESEQGVLTLQPGRRQFTSESDGRISWEQESHGDAVTARYQGSMEFDGYLLYHVEVQGNQDVTLKDIRLELPFREEVATIMMGAGRAGGTMPETYTWNWRGLPQDSFWVGNAFAGIHCELRGGAYHGPLLNRIRPEPPVAWFNGGQGGVRFSKENGVVTATAFSGARSLKKGESVTFEFALLVTPVKPRNTVSQFGDRYYHDSANPEVPESASALGLRVVNVHHGNDVNPYINYPFIGIDAMKRFVNEHHARGIKVKAYYTLRELSNQLAEIWALRSLGHEVLPGGGGGGYPWLQEHLVSGYMPRWYQHFDHKPEGGADAAIANSGVSRWYNYYVESLAWLVRNTGIDGLYLDDVSYDRRILKRIRRAMAGVKPGILIDLHSNACFSKGPAVQYTEFFPYIDKLWFGEGFNYNAMSPDSWMVEVSGIPFGLMGDMLQHGGNRCWLGMVYGMSTRLPWRSDNAVADPSHVWKLWNDFGIADAEMEGYWEPDCPVSTDRADVRATAYVKEGRTLIALGSWAPGSVDVKLDIDWQAIGLDPASCVLRAPAIKHFQPEHSWTPGEPIAIEHVKGWLIIVEPGR